MDKKQIILKSATVLTVIAATVAVYMGFGFFFDVFLEIIPLFAVPVIVGAVIIATKKPLNKKSVIATCSVLLVITTALCAAVGVLATSKPAYGEKPLCGSVEKYTYSRSFMKDNYDIDQKTVIKVWLPEGYSADKKYPVMYVLDGDMFFDYAALEASRHCADGDGDVIIVGIGYGYWNSTFARGGIVWQDTEHVRGRWRDFCFADDTQAGYMPGTTFGGSSKRGKEFSDFIVNTVVKDIRAKYSTDHLNSTIYGHSLGGGMAAYFLTQYDPARGENNPFTNFVIVDNGYLDYYNKHYPAFSQAMRNNGNSAYSPINVYRIWGGTVNPPDNAEQFELFSRINDENWSNVNNYFWLPENADHGATETIGITNALRLILGMDFGHQTTISPIVCNN